MKEQLITHTPEIEAYLKTIRSYKPMTKAEEKAIFTEYKTADDRRKAQIVEMIVKSNAKFVFSEAKKYAKNDENTVLDFVQEGNAGLVKAIDKFDVSTGYKFISFAVWYIKMHMTNFAQTNNRFLKGNVNSVKLAAKIQRIKAQFYQDNHRDPDLEEIKEELEKMGEKIKNVSDLEAVIQNSIDSVWGDEAKFENNPRYVQHSAVENDYEKEVDAEDKADQVSKLLRGLTDREADIIKMLFGIGYDNPIDPEVVAERMNLTPTRIGQIKKAALKKMRAYAETA